MIITFLESRVIFYLDDCLDYFATESHINKRLQLTVKAATDARPDWIVDCMVDSQTIEIKFNDGSQLLYHGFLRRYSPTEINIVVRKKK